MLPRGKENVNSGRNPLKNRVSRDTEPSSGAFPCDQFVPVTSETVSATGRASCVKSRSLSPGSRWMLS